MWNIDQKNMKKIRKKGHDRPRYPPPIFNVPASYCRPMLSSPREVKKRKIHAESRLGQLKFDEQNDVISNWGDMVRYCKELECLLVAKVMVITYSYTKLKECRRVLLFSIIIYEDFKAVCYQEDRKIPYRSLFSRP